MSGHAGGDSSGGPMTLKDKIQAMLTAATNCKDSYLQNVKDIELERGAIAILENDVASVKEKMEELEDGYAALNAKLAETTEKFDETVKGADECERQRRALDHRKNIDEERLAALEQFIRETTEAGIESEKKCDEFQKKLGTVEGDSDRARMRTELAEKKSKDLQDEMKSLTTKLKSMQAKIEKADDLEEKYERTIKDLKACLQNMEKRAADSDSLMRKLQGEVDKVKNELEETKQHYQALKKDLTDSRGHGIKAN